MPWKISKHTEAKQNKMQRIERKEYNLQRKDKDPKCKIFKKSQSTRKSITMISP